MADDYDNYRYYRHEEVVTVTDKDGLVVAYGFPQDEPKGEPLPVQMLPPVRRLDVETSNGEPKPQTYSADYLKEPEHTITGASSQPCLGCEWRQLKAKIERRERAVRNANGG